MKYFIDTEFTEAFTKGICKRRHYIELISIGIVAEDGRKYYAISNEFNEKRANNFVKENVLNKIVRSYNGDARYFVMDMSIKAAKHHFGKSVKTIREEIFRFINPGNHLAEMNLDNEALNIVVIPDSSFRKIHNVQQVLDRKKNLLISQAVPEFYGYFCHYDAVLFSSIFGTMDDLPAGFPMFWYDLKQMLDERAKKELVKAKLFDPYASFESVLNKIKLEKDYPKEQSEHNALADAEWNFELYKYLQNEK